jgi:hypothetical protein
MTVRLVEGPAMKRFRFHIGSLLILVVLLGVGFAALREANDLWDSIVLTSAFWILMVSVLLAADPGGRHRQAERQAFWAGFALFGWIYLGLIAIPSIEPRLLTTKALAYLDSKVPGRPAMITGQPWGGPLNSTGQAVATVAFSPQGSLLIDSSNSGTVRLWSTTAGRLLGSGGGTTENFIHIGHSLFALILACLGGKVSRSLYVRGRETHPVSDEPGESPTPSPSGS